MPLKTAKQIRNRSASNYVLSDYFMAGLVLLGSEVRSAKLGQVDLSSSRISIRAGEAWLVNAYFGQGLVTHMHSTGRQAQKLLLTKRELRALADAMDRKLHIIPIRLMFRHGFVKVELGVGRMQKKYDKRQAIQSRETARNLRTRMNHVS